MQNWLQQLPLEGSRMACIEQAEQRATSVFARLEAVALQNQARVLAAFREYRIEPRHFAPTTGYGYDDIGRDTLDALYARVMGGEAALVRPQFISGTHVLALCLYGVLRPGDTLLCASGRPYDTLEETIGLSGKPGQGALSEYHIACKVIELLPEGGLDVPAILRVLADTPSARMVYLQRSRGYAWRPALTLDDIEAAIAAIRRVAPDVVVMVDNCYGEFVEDREPLHVGADLMAGSLIKNPGGGLAPTGGYIAGRAGLVQKVAYRATTPGIGAEAGSYAATYRPFYQGLFMAPHIVKEAVKGAVLVASVLQALGYETSPAYDAPRSDIIQAVRLGSADNLVAFCQAIQAASPVESHVLPEPWDMPGYQDAVVMAAGAFVQGASIELSCDGPVKPPYTAYLQGGLSYEHVKLALMMALSRLG